MESEHDDAKAQLDGEAWLSTAAASMGKTLRIM